jgi:hypothetical protein
MGGGVLFSFSLQGGRRTKHALKRTEHALEILVRGFHVRRNQGMYSHVPDIPAREEGEEDDHVQSLHRERMCRQQSAEIRGPFPLPNNLRHWVARDQAYR